jgi:hypothetical protein
MEHDLGQGKDRPRRWGLIMAERLPDGRKRMRPVRDSKTGEPVAFATEAEARAEAGRLATADTEFRPAPLRAHEGHGADRTDAETGEPS